MRSLSPAMWAPLGALALLSLFVPALHLAADEPLGSTLTIDQSNPVGAPSDWTILTPDQHALSGSVATQTFTSLAAGIYTLFVEQPSGYATHVTLFNDGAEVASADIAQMSFTLSGTGSWHVVVDFTLVHFGKVAVYSDPKGISFDMIGPNDLRTSGVTPATYLDMPIGQYTVTYKPQGCISMAPRTAQLKKDSRAEFNVTLQCDTFVPVAGGASSSPSAGAPSSLSNTTTDGTSSASATRHVLPFVDVPGTAWFSSYVTDASAAGILTGYADDAGTPTSVFGPGDPVTLAQLAKIAHVLSNTDESPVMIPLNTSAQDTWAASYVASAERRDWIVFIDAETDVSEPATRGEVLATLLQALNIPLQWPTGNLFPDVTRRTMFAAAIETGAAQGFVSGSVTGIFGPDLPINRAEMAKIVSIALSKK